MDETNGPPPPPPEKGTATSLVPSVEHATDVQLRLGKSVSAQVAPESDERKTGPRAPPPNGTGTAPAATIKVVPSPEEATAYQFVLDTLAIVHTAPESAEVKMPPPLTATTNLRPSAEDATACQFVMGALHGVQVAPEFVEV